jgi:hypothetical protein
MYNHISDSSVPGRFPTIGDWHTARAALVSPDLFSLNFLEYWQAEGNEVKHFSWVTDFAVTLNNPYQIMRGGRSKWKAKMKPLTR